MGKADVFTGMSLTEKLIWLKKFGNGGGSTPTYADRTATGNPVIFTTNFAQNAKALSIDFAPKQSLNGFDHPWAGGGGKNLLKFPYSNGGTTTKKGVKFTVNANGTVSASGTASEDVGFDLAANLLSYLNVSAGQVVYFSSGIAYDDKEYLRLLYANNNAGIGRITSQNFALTITEEIITRGIRVQIRVISGKTASKTFSPIVSLEPVATYEPYSNICPITGIDSVDVVANSVTHEFDLGRTVYGGTLTVNSDGSGTLTVTHKLVMLAEQDIFRRNTNTTGIYRFAFNPSEHGIKGAHKFIVHSNVLKTVDSDGTYLDSARTDFVIGNDANDYRINFYSSTLQTVEAWKAFATEYNVQVMYLLETPTTYALSAEQIALIQGQNVIATDGDNLSVTYQVKV